MTGSMNPEALRIHRDAILVDGHCDTPFRLLRHGLHIDDPDATAQVDLQTLIASGISASFFVSYVPPYRAGRGAAEFAIAQIERIREEAGRHPQSLTLTLDAEGIRTAHGAERWRCSSASKAATPSRTRSRCSRICTAAEHGT